MSVRSENALKSRKIETFGQLVQLSDKELLDIRAFGAKSLAEIRDTIWNVLSSHGVTGRSVEKNGAGESPIGRLQIQDLSPGGWEIPPHKVEKLDSSIDLLDLSVRSTNALKLLHISTIRQLINLSKRELAESKNMGRKSIAEVSAKLVSFLSHGPQTDSETGNESFALESGKREGVKAFVSKMLAMLPDRQRTVINDRYGLWDGIAETLQDIGDKLGLTRERIRQIEASGLKRIRRLNTHGTIKQFIFNNVLFEIEANKAVRFGVVSEEEAIVALAPDLALEEAGLAATFLQDVQSPGQSIFADILLEIENKVYCVDKDTAKNYLEMLRLLELTLQALEKPLTEGILIKEIGSRSNDELTPDQLAFARRIVSVSTSFARLRNGTIALSKWTESRGLSAPTLTETALRLLGRPAHFREIAEKVNSIVEDARALTEGTIRTALTSDGEKFIWVKRGTFGLAVWGLKKPPYVKDRLVDLLSVAGYPLPLWHLEEKVLEVCNCKPTSVRMTLDLNPKIFSKFAGDQYGLHKYDAKSKA